MAEMVAGAIFQEGVSRSLSHLLGKRKERTPEGHSEERLEMAVTKLGLALERSVKLPMIDVWLIHRRRMLKRAYDEAANLLLNCKRESLQRDHSSQRWFAQTRKFSILSRLGLFGEGESRLSCSDLARFERFAEWADEFVKDVESGISLWQHHTFRYPLERQLLEGKTLTYEMVKGSQSRRICIWPICSEGRGVEVYLYYSYEDRKMPVTFFDLDLKLRMSACTDIIGTAISCFQYLACQFKIATKLALGEIHELSYLQDRLSHSHAPPLGWNHDAIVYNSKSSRPDPICCTNKVVSSSVSSLRVPEPVVKFDFGWYVSAVEHILPSSTTDEVVGMNSPPLYLEIILWPHSAWGHQKQEIVLEFEGKEEHVDGSVEHMDAILWSKAIEYVVSQPDDVEAEYKVRCTSPHGYAFMCLEKPRVNPTWVRRPGRVISAHARGASIPRPILCHLSNLLRSQLNENVL
ncbi:unnamed protein product [Urochloa decumbens]|uniref:Uncharacterized protein n=1 Tax=Urochloa decumbens TaxID=240449 RepID=A0ABC9FPJ1_9POAL